jgi:hypothetical protein
MKITIGVMTASLSVLCLAACSAPGTVKPGAANVAQNQTCVAQSGSLIAQSDPNATVGRCYTNDDIRRTGASTVGEALPLLDPAITVHH